MLAQSEPLAFGFLQRPPPPSFPGIERTAVNQRGYLAVNGQPYFPVYWTPHFGVCPEADYPPTVCGMKALDLTDVACSRDAMPDDAVKARLLAKVAAVKERSEVLSIRARRRRDATSGPAVEGPPGMVPAGDRVDPAADPTA